MTRSKIILYIDGSNLFGGLSELLGLGEYIAFPSLLTVIEQDIQIDVVYFYATYMRIDPTKNNAYRVRVMTQKKFFDSAKTLPKVTFYKGHFSGYGKEKGIDVHLAVDMAVGAATNQYETAIIMTGDADLKYPVEKAREFGKTVHLAAVGSRFPFGIAPLVSKIIILDIDNFFTKHIISSYRGKLPHFVTHELRGNVKIKKININPAESAGDVPL